MLVKWLGLYPLLVAVSYLMKWISVEPLWFKLICTTAILVPLLNYVITPLMDSLFSEWLYKGIDEEEQHKSINIGS
ncbi:hypothetical protein [Neolewinella antarctica]|nr:hypothetical protein [Neolewinella antarctica]